MDEMDEVYRKIQMTLMKKNREYGELRFLTSRTTTEKTSQIDDICKSVVLILDTYGIPMEGKDLIGNERCIQSYKYLLLNTNFKNQQRLAEDIVHGHLVDMCPPLSPYLFIQILWDLRYEKILIESLLYLPFDICSELLEIVRKCLEDLSFERSLEIIYQLMSNTYAKFVQLRNIGSQSINLDWSVKNLMANFQELILLLVNPKLTDSSLLSGLKKSERYGVILKSLLQKIKGCFEYQTQKVLVSMELEKLYKITFGREAFIKYEDTLMKQTIDTLNQEMLNVLLTKIKEIDCNIYLGWAELDDQDNNKISLQRSIGNECFYFIELLVNDEQLSQNTHLIECLQQLSSKPDSGQSGYVLSLQELCHAISDGKKEHMKELMCRYRNWDRSILDFICNSVSLLDADDCASLLDYLTFVLTHSDQNDEKEFTYTSVMNILSLQKTFHLYEIVMEYVTKHDGKNILESPHTEEAFNAFISRNSILTTPESLRIILLFLLQNPKMVLTTLVKIAIGHPDYKNIMISGDNLLLLRPFLRIRQENNQILLTSILQNVCIANIEWNARNFKDFQCIMLRNSVFTVDDLMNNIFIPYLESVENVNVANMNSILFNIRALKGDSTRNTNVKGLIIALAKRMSFLRKDTTLSKYTTSEIFNGITSILQFFLDTKSCKITVQGKKEIIGEIEPIVEPLDKSHFAPLWHLTQKGINVIDVIQDYERRCFVVLNRLKEDPQTSERLRFYLLSFSLLREDFLRHLIIRSIEEEYIPFGSELVAIYGFLFGWADEMEAFDNLLRITMEACCLSLEYPSVGPNDLFVYLLQCVKRFCKGFVRLEGVKSSDEVYHSLIKNINSLDSSIRHNSYFTDLFTAFQSRLNDGVQNDSRCLVQDVLKLFDGFCSHIQKLDPVHAVNVLNSTRSPKMLHFYVTHEIISACMKVPAAEAYECIARMNELFTSS